MVDVAFPTKRNYRASGSDPLRWALRCLSQHLEHDRVFIVGDLPSWVEPTSVVHIPVVQDATKFVNIGRNIRAAAGSEISDRFLWMNDDFFLLEDVEEVPLYCRHRSFREVVQGLHDEAGDANHRAYCIGMRGQLEILERWGFTEPHCTDLHVPIPLERGLLLEVLDRASHEPGHELGHFRALYGAGLDAEPMMDVKLRHHRDMPREGAWVTSTNPVAWEVGDAGKMIRRRYHRPSPYERRK